MFASLTYETPNQQTNLQEVPEFAKRLVLASLPNQR